jgi:ribonuclease HI
MKLIIHSDGGSRGNPGPAAYGFVILDENEEIVLDGGKYLGTATNNEAEYQGVIAALETLLTFQKLSEVESLTIKLDSKLVVEQVLGHWKVKEVRMVPLVQRVRELLTALPVPYMLQHVPRTENKKADIIVNQTLDSQVIF